MKRLTQKQSAGYDLKALNGQYCNNYCDEQSATTCRDCAIYQAIQKLARYEDTGLTPEQVMKLKERNTAKMCKQSIFDHDSITCACGSDMDKDVEFMFCPWCGQRLKKWEE